MPPAVRVSDDNDYHIYDEHGNTFKSTHQAIEYLLRLNPVDSRCLYRLSTDQEWHCMPPSAELLILGESFYCADDYGYFMEFCVVNLP